MSDFFLDPGNVTILIYGAWLIFGLPLLVRPLLRRSTGGSTRERELPYITIPAVLLSFLLLLYEVWHHSPGGYDLHEKYRISGALILLALSSVFSIYYAVILPRVFYLSFNERSFIKPLSPLKTVIFILPVPVVTVCFWGFLAVAFFDPDLRFLEMEASFSWLSLPACLVILWLLNRVFLRPYLIRTKGLVSRDDQLPYFVISMFMVVLSLFLFDAYRYNLEAIRIEQLRFSVTLFFVSSIILFIFGAVFPRAFDFRFQEIAFAKQPVWGVLSICIASALAIIGFVIIATGRLLQHSFWGL